MSRIFEKKPCNLPQRSVQYIRIQLLVKVYMTILKRK